MTSRKESRVFWKELEGKSHGARVFSTRHRLESALFSLKNAVRLLEVAQSSHTGPADSHSDETSSAVFCALDAMRHKAARSLVDFEVQIGPPWDPDSSGEGS